MQEWQIYERLEPWGDEWRQIGMICAQIWNAQRTNGKAVNAETFMPLPVEQDEDGDDEPQSVETVKAIFAGHGLTVNTNNGNH